MAPAVTYGRSSRSKKRGTGSVASGFSVTTHACTGASPAAIVATGWAIAAPRRGKISAVRDAERRGDPLAAAEQIPRDTKFRTHDPLEHQRGPGIRRGQERRQLERAIDRLVDPPQRAVPLEPAQERPYGLAITHAHITARVPR